MKKYSLLDWILIVVVIATVVGIVWWIYRQIKAQKEAAVPTIVPTVVPTVTASTVSGSNNNNNNNPAATAPNAATTLAVTSTQNTVSLSWVAPTTGTAPTAYRVMRRTVAGSFAEIALVNAPNVVYTDSSAVVGTFYYYKVVATNAQGNAAAASNTVSATAQNPNAYGMASIAIQQSSWSATRFQVTPTETNRPAGARDYTLIVKDSNGNTVYNFGNPTNLDTAVYGSIDFTPNNQQAPVNSRITVPGTYTVELTSGGVTQSQSITFSAANLQLA